MMTTTEREAAARKLCVIRRWNPEFHLEHAMEELEKWEQIDEAVRFGKESDYIGLRTRCGPRC